MTPLVHGKRIWPARVLARVKRYFLRRQRFAPIHYCLPAPSVFHKLYNQDELFEKVEWSDWSKVVDGFEARIEKWYFDQMRGDHASYVDFCALCALVDFFSLHQSQRSWHSPPIYKEFLRKLDPVFRRRLPQAIHVSRNEGGTWRPGSLKDIADVFYVGVRCSLHHHSDLASYAAMTGSGELAKIIADAGRSVCGRHTYSLVVFDPAVLKARLRTWFVDYCTELRSEPASQLARHFRARMLAAYGVVVP